MSEHVAFCSANDRPVPVTLRAEREPATADPHELVCLDYGTRCTGALCPLLSVPDEEDFRTPAFAPPGRVPLPGIP